MDKHNVFAAVAESILNFSNHKINRLELFDVICGCFQNITEDEKKSILAEKNNINPNPHYVARNWLIRK